MPAALNPAEPPKINTTESTSFQHKYLRIKFGRIKETDKLKFCPLETLLIYPNHQQCQGQGQGQGQGLDGLGNYLPWAPPKTVNRKKISENTFSESQSKSNSSLQTSSHISSVPAHVSVPLASSTSVSVSVSVPPSVPAPSIPTESGPSSGKSGPNPSSWSALLKSSQQSDTSTSSTPSLPKKKIHQPSINNVPNANHQVHHQKQHFPHIEKWRVINTSQRGALIIPRGLVNNGNTCYMNSILQPLLHTPPIYIFLLGLQQRRIDCPAIVETPILDSMMKFVSSFRTTTTSDPLKQTSEDFAFSCEYVYDAIRQSFARTALKGRQEDASEYLSFILDGMHEELLKTIDRPKIEAESGAEWTQVGKKNKLISTQSHEVNPTQITRIFQGIWKSTLCAGSKESVTTEPFTSLHVEASHNSIINALRSISALEVLEPHHEGTESIVQTKQVHLEKLPPILFISIKRFKIDLDGKALKITKHIDVPMKLDIPAECLSSTMAASPTSPREEGKVGAKTYQLYAVVQHHGKALEGGHYTCDILHQSGQWLRFDDSSVTQIDSSLVATQHKEYQPYLLFYIENRV